MLAGREERFSASMVGGIDLGGRGEGGLALRGPLGEVIQGSRGDFGPLAIAILLVLHGNKKVLVVEVEG